MSSNTLDQVHPLHQKSCCHIIRIIGVATLSRGFILFLILSQRCWCRRIAAKAHETMQKIERARQGMLLACQCTMNHCRRCIICVVLILREFVCTSTAILDRSLTSASIFLGSPVSSRASTVNWLGGWLPTSLFPIKHAPARVSRQVVSRHSSHNLRRSVGKFLRIFIVK